MTAVVAITHFRNRRRQRQPEEQQRQYIHQEEKSNKEENKKMIDQDNNVLMMNHTISLSSNDTYHFLLMKQRYQQQRERKRQQQCPKSKRQTNSFIKNDYIVSSNIPIRYQMRAIPIVMSFLSSLSLLFLLLSCCSIGQIQSVHGTKISAIVPMAACVSYCHIFKPNKIATFVLNRRSQQQLQQQQRRFQSASNKVTISTLPRHQQQEKHLHQLYASSHSNPDDIAFAVSENELDNNSLIVAATATTTTTTSSAFPTHTEELNGNVLLTPMPTSESSSSDSQLHNGQDSDSIRMKEKKRNRFRDTLPIQWLFRSRTNNDHTINDQQSNIDESRKSTNTVSTTSSTATTPFLYTETDRFVPKPWEEVVYPLFELNSFDNDDWFWHGSNNNANGNQLNSTGTISSNTAQPFSTDILDKAIIDENAAATSNVAVAISTAVVAKASSSSSSDNFYIHPDNRISVRDAAVISVGAVSLLCSYIGLICMSGTGAWRYYLAGGICAAVSHVIPVPIDVIKTRKQIDPTLSDQSFVAVARHIIKTDGPISLLGGFGPTALGYLLEGSIKFGVYEVLKPIVLRYLRIVATVLSPKSVSSTCTNMYWMSFIVSASLSGFVASLILCPMEALRIRIVANPEQFNKNKGGWFYGGYRIVKQEGTAALTKGVVPMICKQVPYTITKNVSFDFITKYIYSLLLFYNYSITANVKFAVPLVSASISSVLSAITSQPGDMLLSLINAPPVVTATACNICGGGSTSTITTANNNNNNNNATDMSTSSGTECLTIIPRRRTLDVILDILQSEKGIAGFFVGMKERLLHVGIIVTLQLFIYDFVKRLCGIGATGM